MKSLLCVTVWNPIPLCSDPFLISTPVFRFYVCWCTTDGHFHTATAGIKTRRHPLIPPPFSSSAFTLIPWRHIIPSDCFHREFWNLKMVCRSTFTKSWMSLAMDCFRQSALIKICCWMNSTPGCSCGTHAGVLISPSFPPVAPSFFWCIFSLLINCLGIFLGAGLNAAVKCLADLSLTIPCCADFILSWSTCGMKIVVPPLCHLHNTAGWNKGAAEAQIGCGTGAAVYTWNRLNHIV